MFSRRTSQALAVLSSAVICAVGSLAFVDVGIAAAGTGPGASGNTITNAAQAQTPFSAGTYDSGQPIDVVIPANSVLTPGATIFILECAAPHGVDPTTINSCDGNTGYGGGTVSVNSDGSIDVINSSTVSGDAYTVYALPDHYTFRESPSTTPKCGLGSANECVLYIGQGGGNDIGLSAPHFFSQAFQVHTDPTDSGTLNPGDGTFPADAAPAITSAASYTFTHGTSPNFTVTATGYPVPTFSDSSGSLDGLTLNATTGVLSGTPTTTGTFTSTITASNGIGSPATQPFSLTVNSSGIAPSITSGSSTTFTVGTAGTFTVTATGSPAPTFSKTGTLPSGVTLNSTTGVLSGTPAAGTAGSYPITITAANGVLPNATQSFTLTVTASPNTTITCAVAGSTTFASPGLSFGGALSSNTTVKTAAAITPTGAGCSGLPIKVSIPSATTLCPATSGVPTPSDPSSCLASKTSHGVTTYSIATKPYYYDTTAQYTANGLSDLAAALAAKPLKATFDNVAMVLNYGTASQINPGGVCGSGVGFYLTGNAQVKLLNVATYTATVCLSGDAGTGTTGNFFNDLTAPNTIITSATVGGPSNLTVTFG